jgi:hypothetical protein
MLRLTLALLALPLVATAEVVSIPVPDQGWQITLDTPHFAQKAGQKQGPNYVYQANSDKFNLSIYVEPPAKAGGNKECYEHYWALASRNPLISKPTVKVSNTDKYYRVEYDLSIGGGLAHKNVNYYFLSNGKWVDIHISIIDAKKEDAAIFAAFDKGLSYGPLKPGGEPKEK